MKFSSLKGLVLATAMASAAGSTFAAPAPTSMTQAQIDALHQRAKDESPMAGLYGNTVVVIHPNGNTLRFHFNADKTFTYTASGPTVKLPAGAKTAGGTFKILSRQMLSLSFTGAAASAQESYLPMGPIHDLNDTWVIKPGDVWTDAGGSKYSIVAGLN